MFTLVVTAILFMVCISIYYFSGLNRERAFRQRLQNRALSTFSLLLKVEGIDSNLLQKIDQSTYISIQERSIVVYNDKNREEYVYTDQGVPPVKVDITQLNKARAFGDFYFTQAGKEILVTVQFFNKERYTVVAAAMDRDGKAYIAQLRLILLFSFFSGTMITFFIGLIFSGRIVLPIKRIINEVKLITSSNLSQRIKVNEPMNELDDLSATFNELLTRLQDSFETQGRFISNASHELSTPLTSISTQLEITLQKERNTDEYKAIIFSVYEDVRNLNVLTRSLLEIAKAGGTSKGIELSEIRIDELLLRLPSELKRTETNYVVAIDFETFPFSEKKLLVFGISDLLYIAIKNIVLNACKFASDHIAYVSLVFSEDHLFVVVKNKGSVISDEDKNLIFQPFYRGSSTAETKGFGLGLSLALRIIKLHKGNITMESSYSEGTIFSIQLPSISLFQSQR